MENRNKEPAVRSFSHISKALIRRKLEAPR
jgi:hypothetical protein